MAGGAGPGLGGWCETDSVLFDGAAAVGCGDHKWHIGNVVLAPGSESLG